MVERRSGVVYIRLNHPLHEALGHGVALLPVLEATF